MFLKEFLAESRIFSIILSVGRVLSVCEPTRLECWIDIFWLLRGVFYLSKVEVFF